MIMVARNAPSQNGKTHCDAPVTRSLPCGKTECESLSGPRQWDGLSDWHTHGSLYNIYYSKQVKGHPPIFQWCRFIGLLTRAYEIVQINLCSCVAKAVHMSDWSMRKNPPDTRFTLSDMRNVKAMGNCCDFAVPPSTGQEQHAREMGCTCMAHDWWTHSSPLRLPVRI